MAEEFDWQARINIDPEIMGGKPVIKGRRVMVEVIVGALAAGATLEKVCEQYVVSEDDVRAALAYAADLVSKQPAHAVSG